MHDFHIVDNGSAAGSLRYAVQTHRLSGKVFCTGDPLNVGPLNDGRERLSFWRGLDCGYSLQRSESYSESGQDDSDIFAPWLTIQQCIEAERPDRVLLWASGTGADYVFLRMACHRLAGTGVALFHVPVPPVDGTYHAVACFPPEELVPFVTDAVALPDARCSALAQEFEAIAARPELLRECDAQGQLHFRPVSAHDDLLIKNCSTDWRQAASVVGETMGRGDPRNPLGDAFLCWRLQYLIDAGKVEADGPRTELRAYRVRLRPGVKMHY